MEFFIGVGLQVCSQRVHINLVPGLFHHLDDAGRRRLPFISGERLVFGGMIDIEAVLLNVGDEHIGSDGILDDVFNLRLVQVFLDQLAAFLIGIRIPRQRIILRVHPGDGQQRNHKKTDDKQPSAALQFFRVVLQFQFHKYDYIIPPRAMPHRPCLQPLPAPLRQ